MGNYIFYHCFCVNDYLSRFQETYKKICDSGLIESVSKIYVVSVGPEKELFKSKIEHLPKITCLLGDNSGSESETLRLLWDKSQTEEFNALYLHSKGVTKPNNKNVQSWVDYMEYFCITKYNACIHALENYDSCGVNLRQDPMPHYSGNFWWAKSSYIKTRDRYDFEKSTKIKDERLYCEFWLLDSKHANAETLRQNDVDFYRESYPKSKYMESFNIGIQKVLWTQKKLDVKSAWSGLEDYIGSILETFHINTNSALEFGVDSGYSSFILSQLFKKVTGVDYFQSDIHTGHEQGDDFYKRIKEQFKNTNVGIVRMDFREFIKNCSSKYDLIHIDIIHTYLDTLECAEWAVKHSDVVILHDTVSYPDINRVCLDLSKKYNLGYHNIPEHYGLGILYKR